MPPTGPREHTSDISYRRRERSRSRSPYPGDHKQERGRPRDRSRNRRSYSRSPPRRRSRSYSCSSSRSRSRTSHHRKRLPSRSRSKERGKKRKSRSRSRSSSLSTISDRDGHRKRHKEKHRKRSRSKERKLKKKEKKEKKKNKGSSTSQWGKFGIINESDLYNKEAEFRTWLVEDRMINPETMSKDATKKEFARFMEDFNTATLSHEKYYDMAKYEQRMSLIRNGETLPNTDDRYDVNADLAAHSSSHKRANKEHESYLSKEQLQELRRVQQERFQVGKMKVLGLDIKQNMGVRMDGNEFEG